MHSHTTYIDVEFDDPVWKIYKKKTFYNFMIFIFLLQLSKMYWVGKLEWAEQRSARNGNRNQQIIFVQP